MAGNGVDQFLDLGRANRCSVTARARSESKDVRCQFSSRLIGDLNPEADAASAIRRARISWATSLRAPRTQICNRCMSVSPLATDFATARQAMDPQVAALPQVATRSRLSRWGCKRIEDKSMASRFPFSTVVTRIQRLWSAENGASDQILGSPDKFMPLAAWRASSGLVRSRWERGTALLVASLIAAPAIASTLMEGSYVRVGRSCDALEMEDRLISNGYSVSPPGQTCRIVSRTSTGGYYPIFNQRCTDSEGDSRFDVRVISPDRIEVNRPGRPAVAYRRCRAQAAPLRER